MLDFKSWITGTHNASKIGHRPDNVCQSSSDLAKALVSELAGVAFGEIQWGKDYLTNELGAMCFIKAYREGVRVVVEIAGYYKGNENWVFEDELVSRLPAYTPIIQIDCGAFDDGVVYQLQKRTAKEVFELAILYVDSLGYAKRIGLGAEIRLNQYPTPAESERTGNDFYTCSWVEVANVAMEQDHKAKWEKFLGLVRLYCRTLDKGLCQCGFKPDVSVIELVSGKAENKIKLEFRELRSATPPLVIETPVVDPTGIDAVEVAIRTVEANALAIENALAFESDERYRKLILFHSMKILLAESDEETEKLFGDMGESIRDYYNCGKKIMKLADQIIQRGLTAQAAALHWIRDVRMRTYIRRNLSAQSLTLRELCNTLLPYCESIKEAK